VSKLVNLYDAKTQLSRLVEEAAAGEEIIIAKAGRARARLVAVDAGKRPRKPGRGKRSIKILKGFDDPLPADVLAAFGSGVVETDE
jgi:prevent-host-death family protein